MTAFRNRLRGPKIQLTNTYHQSKHFELVQCAVHLQALSIAEDVPAKRSVQYTRGH